MSLVTILLLYLADRDAMASAKRHTCSAWRKEWQSECEKAIPEWAPFHPSNWLAMGHTSKANIPEISVFYPSCHHVVGQWIGLMVVSLVWTWFISLCIQWCLWLNECLSGGKVALIYYGSVALTFTVRHVPRDHAELLIRVSAISLMDQPQW